MRTETELEPKRPADYPRAARPDVLVDTEWLTDHLDDPQVRVVEVDVSPSAFAAGHIAGAVLWDIYADLKDADYHTADHDAVERVVSRSGIAADSIVVFYGYGPALGFWLMKLYGHREIRILDASRETWQEECRPWTRRVTTPTATGYRLAAEGERIRARRATVEQAIDDPRATILDVRTAPEYRGERFWPSGGMDEYGRAGHIPSATHLPADDLRDVRGAFLPDDDLAAVYAPAALSSDSHIISYCTIGSRAATTWFVLTHLLGHTDVHVYDGSWAEWGRTPDAPVTTEAGIATL